jgi:DNA-binding transcriptional MerR regulator
MVQGLHYAQKVSMRMKSLTIGHLARESGVNLETMRYYERRGLLPKPPRSASGYRLFPSDAARRLRFIRRAQELGFSLKEIRELLSLRVSRTTTTCGRISGTSSRPSGRGNRSCRTSCSVTMQRSAVTWRMSLTTGRVRCIGIPVLRRLSPKALICRARLRSGMEGR